jgi:hypothetical protein
VLRCDRRRKIGNSIKNKRGNPSKIDSNNPGSWQVLARFSGPIFWPDFLARFSGPIFWPDFLARFFWPDFLASE